jgi:membrane protease YdiL (CAAX protease family)
MTSLLITRVIVRIFFPELRGQGLTSGILLVLIPIWSLGAIGGLLWIIGYVRSKFAKPAEPDQGDISRSTPEPASPHVGHRLRQDRIGGEGTILIAENPFLKIKTRGVLLWALLGLLILGFIYEAFKSLSIDENLLESFFGTFVYFGVLYWVYRKCKAGRIDMSFFFKTDEKDSTLGLFGLTVILLVSSLGALWSTYIPLSYVFPGFVESFVLQDELFSSSPRFAFLNNILEVISAVLLAPIVEEIFFRGVLLNRWAAKWGLKKAILASSFVFAILHVDVVGAFVFGAVMAVLYVKSNSLIGPIIVHVLNNALAVWIDLVSKEWPAFLGDNSLEAFRSWFWVGLALFAITMPPLMIYLRRNWPKRDQDSPYVRQQIRYSPAVPVEAVANRLNEVTV